LEIKIVDKKDMPYKPEWANIVRAKIQEIKANKKDGDIIKFILNRNEKATGLESAWRQIVQQELKKTPHVKILKHELGTTVWLWWN
jgi:hypothetical protein